MKKVLFIDRDGTILSEPEDEQVDNLEKLRFVPGVIQNLAAIALDLDYEMVMVTNQDGLGTSSFPEESFWPAHNKMTDILSGEGIFFSEVLIDNTKPEDNASTRKPGTGMVKHYLRGGYDLERSFVIGDRLTDVQFAKNIGCKAIWLNKGLSEDAALITTDWSCIYSFLKEQPRIACCFRKTSETCINITLNLDGEGKSEISTGLGFFDHMLSQIARHSNTDLMIKAQGDLYVDEHHTIEDVGMVFGEALNQALGSKKGIERYGFLLPMDDSLARVAIDFGGRPYLVWDVSFRRNIIGDCPSEMLFHFFKSFADKAGCTINIKAEGINDHHKAEAIFKAFGRAIKDAVKRDGKTIIPSTKGVL